VPIKLNTDLPKTIYVNIEQAGRSPRRKSRKTRTSPCSIRACTLPRSSEGGKLQIEMRAKNGRGYVAADRNYDEDLPIGLHPGRQRSLAGAQGELCRSKQPVSAR